MRFWIRILFTLGVLAVASPGARADSENYFEVLGLDSHATVNEIKAKFESLMKEQPSSSVQDSYLDAYHFLMNERARKSLIAEIEHRLAQERAVKGILESVKLNDQEMRYLEMAEYNSLSVSDIELKELSQRLWLGPAANGKFSNERNFVTTFFLVSKEHRAKFLRQRVLGKEPKGGLMNLLEIASKVYDPSQIYYETFKREFTKVFLEIVGEYYDRPLSAFRDIIAFMYSTDVLNGFDESWDFDQSYPIQDNTFNLSSEESRARLNAGIQNNMIGLAVDFNRYQLGRLLVDMAVETGSPDVYQALVVNEVNARRIMSHFLRDSRSEKRLKNLSWMARYNREGMKKMTPNYVGLSLKIKHFVLELPRTICGILMRYNPLMDTSFPEPTK